MLRKTRKQLGKLFADKFVEKAEMSAEQINRAILENNVTIGEVEELDRMRGYINVMEETADLLDSTYLYKMLLLYKSQFNLYSNNMSSLYRMQRINFYPDFQPAAAPDVADTAGKMANGR